MSRITRDFRTPRSRARRPATGLLATGRTRSLVARSSRPGTPGLIAPGLGFTIPRLRAEHYAFSHRACSAHAANFAANLIRAGVADCQDWAVTRSISRFLEQTLWRFVGERASAIDRAFSIYLHLSPTGDCYRSGGEEPNPRRVLLSFRVVDHVSWVNVTPALELLQKEHELLPSFFYHSLHSAMSQWFRVFDTDDARWRWADWIEMRDDEEEERKTDCERNGQPYAPAGRPDEPRLPACVQLEIPALPAPALSLARSRRAKELIAAVEALAQIAQVPHPPINRLSEQDRQDLFPDADPDVPMLALAFGDHDAVTEFLNDELEMAGQVELEPWPIFKMDGTEPDSIRDAFVCAGLALDLLAAASRVLLLIPGFEPMS